MTYPDPFHSRCPDCRALGVLPRQTSREPAQPGTARWYSPHDATGQAYGPHATGLSLDLREDLVRTGNAGQATCCAQHTFAWTCLVLEAPAQR